MLACMIIIVYYLSLQPTVNVVPPANVATIAREVAVSVSARAVMVPPATVVISASVSRDVAAAPHVVSSLWIHCDCSYKKVHFIWLCSQ